MLRNLSSRDRLIAIILPGMLLLLGYLYGVRPKETKKLADLQKRIVQAEAGSPSVTEMQAGMRDAVAAEKAAREARQEVVRQREAVEQATLHWLDAGRRTAAAETFSSALRGDGLMILDEQPASGDSREVQHALQQLRTVMLEQAGGGVASTGKRSRGRRGGGQAQTPEQLAISQMDLGQPWKISFVGDYPNVSQVMMELAEDGGTVLPLHLTMAPPLPNNTKRLWTLTIWK